MDVSAPDEMRRNDVVRGRSTCRRRSSEGTEEPFVDPIRPLDDLRSHKFWKTEMESIAHVAMGGEGGRLLRAACRPSRMGVALLQFI